MKLHVPKFSELGFRAALLADPEAMSYNRGYDLAFSGYHRDTGCIDFPPEAWPAWYEVWVESARENRKFYAYVEQDGAFVGEVSLHSTDGGKCCELGVLIAPRFRGKGFSKEALRLLKDHAFNELGAEMLTNRFEKTREAAVRLHRSLGFTVKDEGGGMLVFALPRPTAE